MRTTRVEKKVKRKKYIRNLLWTFLVIIPVAAVTCAFVLNFTMNREPKVTPPAAAGIISKVKGETLKNNFEVGPKVFYRVEIKKYDKYEDAEANLITIKNKKLNGFIVKEQGYVVAYGVYLNKSQGDTAAKFLKRKGIQSTVNEIRMDGITIKYENADKTLIDLVKATDGAVMKIVGEKAALSLESLYSNKEISGQSLKEIADDESRLDRYLNYLAAAKASEEKQDLKKQLEALIKAVQSDRISSGGSYGYYDLQDSLMNQLQALHMFYEKLLA